VETPLIEVAVTTPVTLTFVESKLVMVLTPTDETSFEVSLAFVIRP